MKQRLMELYFSEGADLSDKAVLVKAAADVGLDADAVSKKLDSNEDLDVVSQRVEAAKSAGIQGVPFFIVDNTVALVRRTGAGSTRCRDPARCERQGAEGGGLILPSSPSVVMPGLVPGIHAFSWLTEAVMAGTSRP